MELVLVLFFIAAWPSLGAIEVHVSPNYYATLAQVIPVVFIAGIIERRLAPTKLYAVDLVAGYSIMLVVAEGAALAGAAFNTQTVEHTVLFALATIPLAYTGFMLLGQLIFVAWESTETLDDIFERIDVENRQGPKPPGKGHRP
jgi:hypothetical protein